MQQIENAQFEPQERGSVIKPWLMSHGTMQAYNLKESRQFYEEFLGLECVRQGKPAIFIRCGMKWHIVVVQAGQHVKPAHVHQHDVRRALGVQCVVALVRPPDIHDESVGHRGNRDRRSRDAPSRGRRIFRHLHRHVHCRGGEWRSGGTRDFASKHRSGDCRAGWFWSSHRHAGKANQSARPTLKSVHQLSLGSAS